MSKPSRKTNNQSSNQMLKSDVKKVTKNGARGEIVAATQSTTLIHQGPLPDPDTMERYDRVCPGAAERIISMAERQSLHRQGMEKKVVESRARDSLLGVICGFILAAGALGIGCYVVLQGHEWSGTFLGTSGLAGLAGVFVYGTRESRLEREKKMELMNQS